MAPSSIQCTVCVTFLICCGLVVPDTNGQTIIYVDDDAPPAGDGTTWHTAYAYLQDALAVATDGDQIRVAGGTYKPDQDEAGLITPGDRNATFELISGVGLYGGYAGVANPDNHDERNLDLYQTILSGDLQGDDGADFVNTNDNSYHVVFAGELEALVILEGFVVSGGNAYGGFLDPRASGGAIYVENATLALTSCHLIANSATRFGGGIFSDKDSSLTLTNCEFRGNRAQHHGGGAYFECLRPNISRCTFAENSALYGGGIYNSNNEPSVTDSVFIANAAGGGGGMKNWAASPAIRSCTFTANRSTLGGAIRNYYATATIISCLFTNNDAEYGGAVHNTNSVLIIKSCTFDENHAQDEGGAICDYEITNSTMTNCIFRNNQAFKGGGLHDLYSSNVTLSNCAFTGNRAEYGGGIGAYGSNGLFLSNCTLAHNSSPYGAALACRSYPPNHPSILAISNSVLWDDAPVWNNDGSTISINYSDIAGGWPGVGNIDADPSFVDSIGPDGIPGTEDDDLSLSPGSPCIDAGDNDAVPPDLLDLDHDGDIDEPVPFDLDGFPRFVDDPDTPDTGNAGEFGPPIVDMGAYEYQLPIMAPLDIMPRRCPNPLNLKMQGMLRMALVGTDALDVLNVDLDSLLLKRADGIGGAIEPLMTPSGLAPEIRDVAAPFEGELCHCHHAGQDGLDDLLLRFSGRKLIRSLELESVPDGTSIELTLTGALQGGTAFKASDCVFVRHPAMTPTAPSSQRKGRSRRP